MEVIQVARKCGIRQEASVCSGVDEGVEQDVGNRDEVVDGIPPTDRWANRINEPRVGIVLEVLCRS